MSVGRLRNLFPWMQIWARRESSVPMQIKGEHLLIWSAKPHTSKKRKNWRGLFGSPEKLAEKVRKS